MGERRVNALRIGLVGGEREAVTGDADPQSIGHGVELGPARCRIGGVPLIAGSVECSVRHQQDASDLDVGGGLAKDAERLLEGVPEIGQVAGGLGWQRDATGRGAPEIDGLGVARRPEDHDGDPVLRVLPPEITEETGQDLLDLRVESVGGHGRGNVDQDHDLRRDVSGAKPRGHGGRRSGRGGHRGRGKQPRAQQHGTARERYPAHGRRSGPDRAAQSQSVHGITSPLVMRDR